MVGPHAPELRAEAPLAGEDLPEPQAGLPRVDAGLPDVLHLRDDGDPGLVADQPLAVRVAEEVQAPQEDGAHDVAALQGAPHRVLEPEFGPGVEADEGVVRPLGDLQVPREAVVHLQIAVGAPAVFQPEGDPKAGALHEAVRGDRPGDLRLDGRGRREGADGEPEDEGEDEGDGGPTPEEEPRG